MDWTFFVRTGVSCLVLTITFATVAGFAAEFTETRATRLVVAGGVILAWAMAAGMVASALGFIWAVNQ